MRNVFIISADDAPMCANRMYSRYDLVDDYAYSFINGPSYMHKDGEHAPEYNIAVDMDNWLEIGEEDGTTISALVCRKYDSNTNWSIVKCLRYDDGSPAEDEQYLIVDKDRRIQYSFNAEEFESKVS